MATGGRCEDVPAADVRLRGSPGVSDVSDVSVIQNNQKRPFLEVLKC
jgi:hypothetical protein